MTASGVFCEECGQPLVAGSAFCERCGTAAPVVTEELDPAPAVTPVAPSAPTVAREPNHPHPP